VILVWAMKIMTISVSFHRKKMKNKKFLHAYLYNLNKKKTIEEKLIHMKKDMFKDIESFIAYLSIVGAIGYIFYSLLKYLGFWR
jgi:hypothetical protein